MKTIAKMLIVISVLMISFQAFAGKDQVSRLISSNKITYKVIVHMHDGIPSAVRDLYVLITDENGRPIAPAQSFRPGKTEYTFSEVGPVKGTRVAKLSNGGRPHVDQFFCKDDSKTGIFNSGSTYLFNLYITLPYPSKEGNE
jgi:hypothetical protein